MERGDTVGMMFEIRTIILWSTNVNLSAPAVDHEGEVLESFVTKQRDRKAALKFLSVCPESSCVG